MSRGLAKASWMAPSVISENVTRWVLAAGTCAASATCQAIASPSRSRSVASHTSTADRAARSICATCLRRSSGTTYSGAKSCSTSTPELALARVLRQVADVPVRGENLIVLAEVALNRPRLGGRLHDDKVLGHGGRECSTGTFAPGQPSPAALDVPDAPQEVLVDLLAQVRGVLVRVRNDDAAGRERAARAPARGFPRPSSRQPRGPCGRPRRGAARWPPAGSRGSGSPGTGRRRRTRSCR